MKFQPLYDRVLVRPIAPEQQIGMIIVPDAAREKPKEGQVVSVGDGHVKDDGGFRELNVKTGDRVVFGQYAGSEIKIDGETLLIMREEEILGILSEIAVAATN
jgi:chaperonin GroES